MCKYILSAFSDEAGTSLEEQIAALQRNGIRYMEIRTVNGINICNTPLETVAEYKKKLDEAGIQVVTIGSCIGKVTLEQDYNAHLAMFLHTLGVAKILGATRIRMFSIFMPQGEEPAVYRDLVMQRMEQMLNIAEAVGVTLYHENEKDIYGDTDARVLDLMDAFHGRMQFIFDPANFIQCGQDTKEAWELLAPYVEYLHIKDALADGSVVPAGKGIGNIPYLLKRYKGNVLTVEPHLSVFEGLEQLEGNSKTTINPYSYPSSRAAFDAAVNALKELIL